MFLLTRQAGYNEYGRPKYAYMHAATPQIVSEAPGTRSRTPRVLDQNMSNSTINEDSKSSKGVHFNHIPYTSIKEASRSSETKENVIQERRVSNDAVANSENDGSLLDAAPIQQAHVEEISHLK